MKTSLCGVLALLVLSASPLRAAEWEPFCLTERMIFPSALISLATFDLPEDEWDDAVLGDQMGLLGIEIAAPKKSSEIEVTVTSDAIMEPSTFKGKLPAGGKSDVYYVLPKIRYKFDALVANKQARPVSVSIAVKIDGENAGDATENLTLRSINECPFLLLDADDPESGEDLSFLFAAYVNEDHPLVDKILKDALKSGVVDAFTGYQSGNPMEVLKQVYAVWHAVQQNGVKYSDISTTSGSSKVVLSQHVRLLDDSLANEQANCVDGSVLFASVLRKIGIEAGLVLVPRHCYLGFFGDPERKQLFGLETTMIGAQNVQAAGVPPEFAQVIDRKFHKEASWGSFNEAMAKGTDDLAKNVDNFGKEGQIAYQFIVISDVRKLGVLPIGGTVSKKAK
jgi:hypothetical protein